MHFTNKQTVEMEDLFSDTDNIIDLGGGGEGIIGLLRGKQVTAIDLRQEELDETPDGPLKVVADANNLPFKDKIFTAATAFFFLMYVAPEDRESILKEAYRVLKNDSFMYIWDVIIPKSEKSDKRIYTVLLDIVMGEKTITTGYGTSWGNKTMSSKDIIALANSVGFHIVEERINELTFYIKLKKI